MKKIIVLVLCLGIGKTFAQNHHIYGLFPTYNADLKLSSRWTTSVYSFLALNPKNQSTEGIEYPRQTNAFYIELDAIYGLNEEWSLAGSYTFERASPLTENYRNENRLWLQVQHYKKLSKFNLKNRIRYDFRFIQNRLTGNTDYNPRLRYLLGVDFPLNSNSLYFAAYNEFFFDTYKNRVAAYAENWVFIGIGFDLSKNTKLETGLLNINWIRNKDKDWLKQYYWQVTIIQKFNKES